MVSAKAVDDQLIEELVGRAQAATLRLTGEGGLLHQPLGQLLDKAAFMSGGFLGRRNRAGEGGFRIAVRDDDLIREASGVAGNHSDGYQPEHGSQQLGRDERGTEAGAMPAKVSVNLRPMVTAGFAKDVEEVNEYAAPM